MRIRPAAALAMALLVTACTPQMEMAGAAVVEQRRHMNDSQARMTLAAMCDISVGAYFRELSEAERALTALVCGGVFPTVNVPLSALSLAPSLNPAAAPAPGPGPLAD